MYSKGREHNFFGERRLSGEKRYVFSPCVGYGTYLTYLTYLSTRLVLLPQRALCSDEQPDLYTVQPDLEH